MSDQKTPPNNPSLQPALLHPPFFTLDDGELVEIKYCDEAPVLVAVDNAPFGDYLCSGFICIHDDTSYIEPLDGLHEITPVYIRRGHADLVLLHTVGCEWRIDPLQMQVPVVVDILLPHAAVPLEVASQFLRDRNQQALEHFVDNYPVPGGDMPPIIVFHRRELDRMTLQLKLPSWR